MRLHQSIVKARVRYSQAVWNRPAVALPRRQASLEPPAFLFLPRTALLVTDGGAAWLRTKVQYCALRASVADETHLKFQCHVSAIVRSTLIGFWNLYFAAADRNMIY